jgi:hypothetical protein
MASRVDSEYSSSLSNDQKSSNSYIKQQPGTKLRYNPWDFENPWSHGLCNLTEQCDETCYALCCFPCFTCHLAWRMNESCWITCFTPAYLAILRTKMRTTFRIEVLIIYKNLLYIYTCF